MANPDVTREIFDKSKNYAFGVMQKAKAVVDADVNDSRETLFWLTKDLGYVLGVSGFLASGFEITECPGTPDNNFNVGAGYGYYEGLRIYSPQTVERNLKVSQGWPNRNLSSVVSAVGSTTVSDERMKWTLNTHVNKQVVFLRQSDMTLLSYTVSANSSGALTFQPGDDLSADGIQKGDPYCIGMSTPAADRTDLICLNVFLDYADTSEDADLLHGIGAGAEFDIRKKIRFVLEVIEGVSASDPISGLPSAYTDGFNNYHQYVALAAVARGAGVSGVYSSYITDLRTAIHNITDFLLKAGDSMTGDLDMVGNSITGTEGSADFGTGELEDWNNLHTVRVTVEKTDGTVQAVLRSDEPDAISFGSTPRIQLLNAGETDFVNLQVKTPKKLNDAANMAFVEKRIQDHSHPQYVDRNQLNSLMSRWSETEIEAAVVAKYGRNYMTNTEYVEWTHNMASDFLLMDSLISPTTGPYVGKWIDGVGNITLVAWDLNTIRVVNDSGANILGADIRVTARRSMLDEYLTIYEILQASKETDTASW